MGVRVNMDEILLKVSKSSKVRNKVNKVITRKLETIKRETLNEFDQHPVTREIMGGPGATNSSGTLGGYGNLFSFIGFSSGQRPTSMLKQAIGSTINFRFLKSVAKKRNINFNFLIKVPTMDLIHNASPMPWEGGSWVKGVEEGMSNFSFYMYKKFNAGRSGMGLQADHELRKAIFTPKAYVSEILQNFKRKVRTIK
tara:strand:+ start:1042 stop:1632 length:591 start_codon:yes stop_codon:yes gene_type:complete